LDYPQEYAGRFPVEGSHQVRFAPRFPAEEVNSSFYTPHRPSTYARWASETSERIGFAVKIPKEVTHKHCLVDAREPLARFLAETDALGGQGGPRLVQLPARLALDAGIASSCFDDLRGRYGGAVACEPRHPSWFTGEADVLLADREVARVAAYPAVVPQAAEPGG
jgi:uncharacterized protein YecE (DUF72 family)